jgi:molybdopterin-containing oxidoreductase family membrane subunit
VAAWAAAFVWGAIAVYQDLTIGIGLTNLTSYVPWGLQVIAYIYFIGLSAGAFLLSSLTYGVGMKSLEPVGKYALYSALVLLIMAIVSITFDIGRPFRAVEIFTRPQFHSMMTWMVWLYTVYFVTLLAELSLAIRVSYRPGSKQNRVLASILGLKENMTPDVQARDRRILRGLAIFGIPLAVAFHSGVGALFANVASQEIWHSGLLPLYFLIGALFSGGALFTGLVAFFWPHRDETWRGIVKTLGQIVWALLLFEGLLTFFEYIVPVWYGVGGVRELTSITTATLGPYWWVFWIFMIGLTLAVPGALLYWGRDRPKVIGFASLLSAIAFISVRFELVIPAFVAPQINGLPLAYVSPRLSTFYVPDLFEWQFVTFAVALGILLLYLGRRFLPLFEQGALGTEQ